MKRMLSFYEINCRLFVLSHQWRWSDELFGIFSKENTPNFVFIVAGNATASGFMQLHCTLSRVSRKSRCVESKSVGGQLSGLNLLVTRSKVFLSSGFGRTWQVKRFSLAGGRLIYRETQRSGRKKLGEMSFFKVTLTREWIPDVQSSSAFPHRAVRNSQAAKFHSALSLLPHLPDTAEWIATGAKKTNKHHLVLRKQ